MQTREVMQFSDLDLSKTYTYAITCNGNLMNGLS